MSKPIEIPRTIADVTPQWLTQAFRQRRPDITVRKADILANLGGACTKLRMKLETSDPEFPETVIVKGCLEPHSDEMLPWQYREAAVYERILPEIDGLETVNCHFVQAHEELGSAIIMEDLNRRNITCRNAIEPITSFELAADYLENLARLHARWWNSAELLDKSRFGFVAASLEGGIPRNERIMLDPVLFAELRKKPRAACLSRYILDGPALSRTYAMVKALSREMPFVLLHGDMHPSNLYTTHDGRGGLLDWTPMRGPWAHEIAYFIGGNLDPIDRRAWEKPLLQLYLSNLAALGADAPKFEDAWFAYRIWMIWGIYVWLFNLPEYHSEENITAMTARYGAALIDHDTLPLVERATSTPA